MKVEVALNSYFFALSLMKNCPDSDEKKRCKYCPKIDRAIHRIEAVKEDIIQKFKLFDANAETGPKSLNDQAFYDCDKRPREVKRRLLILKEKRGAEEMPEEFSSLFENLEKAIRDHPPID